MVNNSLINDEGLGIIFDRAFNSSSTFTVPTNNSFGVVVITSYSIHYTKLYEINH